MCRCHGLSSLLEDPLMVLGIIHPVRWAVCHCHTAPAPAATSHAYTDIHITAPIFPAQEFLLFPLPDFDVGTAVVIKILLSYTVLMVQSLLILDLYYKARKWSSFLFFSVFFVRT